MSSSGVNLFVGSQGGTMPAKNLIDRERENLAGLRCFTIAHKYKGANKTYENPFDVCALLDSGAFSHPPDPLKRWTFEQHLENLLQWEREFSRKMDVDNWQGKAISSYDVLIDEKWNGSKRIKSRWDKDLAWWAVARTIAATEFLALHRRELSPRKLVLACQGVTAIQYLECVKGVLNVATPDDWIGLGGWCVVGMPLFKAVWLKEFHRTLRLIIPEIANAGVRHVHLFGVLEEEAIAPFAWWCHQYGLSCSTDSKQPILACRFSGIPTIERFRKSGARCNYWRDNVQWWQQRLTNIERSPYYCSEDWGVNFADTPLGKLLTCAG